MFVHIVYDCTPGRYSGGVAKVAFELASSQNRLRQTEVWTATSKKHGYSECYDDLTVRFFPSREFFGVTSSSAMVKYALSLPRESVNVVHGHNTFHPLNQQTYRIAKHFGARLFFHPHGALDPSLFNDISLKSLKKRAYTSFFERPLLNRANGVFALTPLEHEQLISIGVTSPIHTISNGITLPGLSLTSESESRRRLAVQDDAFVVLFIGRITRKKMIEDIISAFGLLQRHKSNSVLLMAGDTTKEPDYTTELQELAKQLGVSSQIKWLGFLDEAGKQAVYSACDVFVHASKSEGMAMAILEAMANQLPVVCTKGCYMHVAAAANAIIQTEQGGEAVYEGLLQLCESAAERDRLARVARDYVQTNHNWASIAESMFSIYTAQGT